jgi:hypothetical protein
MSSTLPRPTTLLATRLRALTFTMAIGTMATAAMAIGAGFLSGCSPLVPDQPTWAEDVAPILAANCVRCHTVPAIGGAPDSFRLDSYASRAGDDGRVVRGAGLMAPYIYHRVTHATNPMPPRLELLDYQIEILKKWSGNLGADRLPVRGPARDGNRPPTMEILNTDEQDGWLILDYEIRDPDHEIVLGALYADDVVITTELHSGRGQARWDMGATPNGTYSLSAVLEDPSGAIAVDLGSREVNHENQAPAIRILRPRRDAILASAAAQTHDVNVQIADPDSAALTMTVRAHLGEEVVDVALAQPAQNGLNTVTWDISGLPEGFSWRLEVIVNDGTIARTAWTGPFFVSHRTTQDTFATISNVLGSCTGCHPGFNIPGIPHDFTRYQGTNGVLGVYSLGGLIYRRAVQQRTMPPVSFAGGHLDDQSAERLGNWLLAGAPQ